MQQTTNYNLNIIERSDNILDSVDALGQNATTIDTTLAGKIDTNNIATSISSASTNSEVAGAKAVYDNSLEIYSTTEQKIGTWIDGKPLYEKTLILQGPTVSSDGTFADSNTQHNIENIDLIFVKQCIAWNNTTGMALLYLTNSNRQFKCNASKTNVYLASNGTAFNNNEIYLTLNYTKTTDSAS